MTIQCESCGREADVAHCDKCLEEIKEEAYDKGYRQAERDNQI